MPLEATHIRFALDIIGRYEIEDMAQYISGAIYPDSRYVSRIERALTHNGDLLRPAFADTDFKKGWQAHFLCDVLHDKVKKTVLTDLSFAESHEENSWVISTAIKLVADIDDMQRFDLQACLPALDFSLNPNGEDLGRVTLYNQGMKSLYAGK